MSTVLCTDHHYITVIEDVITEQALHKATALFILKLLSDHYIPQSVVDKILTDIH